MGKNIDFLCKNIFDCLFTFIQLTLEAGLLSSASKLAAAPRATLSEAGKRTKSGASRVSPGTETTRLQLEKHSPRSLKASQV